MNRLSYRLSAKITAVFLFVLCFLLAAGGILLGLAAARQGCYAGEADYYQSQYCRDIAYQYAMNALGQWRYQEEEGGTLDSALLSQDSNLDFWIYDMSGNLLYENSTKNAEYGYRDEYQEIVEHSQTTGGEGDVSPEIVKQYTIQYAVQRDLSGDDAFVRSERCFQFLANGSRTFIIVAAISILGMIISLIFLACGAGRRMGKEDVVLTWMDRIPCELFAVLLIALEILVMVVGINGFQRALLWPSFDTWEYANFDWAIVGILLFIVGALLFLALWISFAARIKAHVVWRNSLTFKLLQAVKRGFFGIPRIWRAMLAYVVFVLINGILFGSGSRWAVWMAVLLDGVMLAFLSKIELDMQLLGRAARALGEGQFDYRVETGQMIGAFKKHGEYLSQASAGLERAVEEKIKSERLRTELITNVSHDIKTPLTSIVNYVGLLKGEKLEGKAEEYLEVLDRQSHRLKKLTEDLIMASKAFSGNIKANMVKTNLCELVEQAVAEYEERMAASKLELVLSIPQQAYVTADGNLLWRILDNLFANALKYAMEGSRVYVAIEEDMERITLAIKNVSREKLNLDEESLMERFVRGDASRSTEGSGLGLSIAQSLADLQNCRFSIHIDGDLFKVRMEFDKAA